MINDYYTDTFLSPFNWLNWSYQLKLMICIREIGGITYSSISNTLQH